MSQASLKTAIEAAREAMRHPRIVAIAAMSSSPTQTLTEAQNRGLSTDEQTWCRLLAKAMRLARELGMDALSILPLTITQNYWENIMKREDVISLMDAASKFMDNHRCAGEENDYDAPILEIMEYILELNGFARQTLGEVPLEIVEELLNQNRSEAILLLIGDERAEAKKILLDCIINPERSQLFYVPRIWGKTFNFKGNLIQKIGPYLALISTELDNFTERYEKMENRFIGHYDWLRFVSGWLTPVEEAEKTIIGPLTKLLLKAGAYKSTDQNIFSKIARVMLLETYFDQDGCFEEVGTDKLISLLEAEESHDSDKILYRNQQNEIDTFCPSSMHDGNNKHILINEVGEVSLMELLHKFNSEC